MRFVIDLVHRGPDSVEGTVTDEVGRCRSFFGWLELLRLLQSRDPVPVQSDADRPAPS